MNVVLRKVIVFVGDATTCADWYCARFGFTKKGGAEGATWSEVDAGGGTTLAFHQAFGQDGPRKQPTGGPMNPHKLVFEVEDLARVRQALLDAGVEVFEISDSEPPRCDGLDVEKHRFQLVQAR